MGMLFISYRRDDTQDITRSIYERLAARFGAQNVFMDVDSIPLGADFRQVLRDAVASSTLALVIIGKVWLSAADEHGQRRLDNPNDFVRIEVEEALARNIPVIPILTHGTPMPRERDLPTSMAALAYRHGADVRSDHHFANDVEQLLSRLSSHMTGSALHAPRSTMSLESTYAPPEVPAQLANLGFRGANPKGTPVILPPMIEVPGGPFLMGADKTKDPGITDMETPRHQVALAAYSLGKYPVTVGEYALAVQAGYVAEPKPRIASTVISFLPIAGAKQLRVTWRQQLERPTHPVMCVSWQDAQAYVAWLRAATGQAGWRLPTEAEWERAACWDAKQSVSYRYPWGDTSDKNRCNTIESGYARTTPVNAYPATDPRRSGASPCGVEDMAGNVYEWTSSLLKPYPYTPFDGRESPDSTEERTLRGGTFGNDADIARSANRIAGWSGLDVTGFRLAFSASTD